jgi:hypothetical protein
MALSFAEIDSQQMELLPPRTVMSMFAMWSTPSGGVPTPGGDVITIEGNHLCGVSIGQVGVGAGILLALGLGNLSPGTSC